MKWRAKYCGNYYIINSHNKVESIVEIGSIFDQAKCESGNYFKTSDEALNSKFLKNE